MSPSNERGEAQRKRAEARQRRRKPSSQEPDEQVEAASGDGDSTGDEPLAAVKQAVKVAAAGAAVGAAAAAARVLSKHEEAGEEEQGDEGAQRPRAEAEPEPEEAQAQTEDPEPGQQRERETRPRPRAQQEPAAQKREERPPGASADEAREVVRQAREQLEALLGRGPDSVSALERTHDGWLVTVEVVEVSRIPESTDVLASYEVELDEDRNLRRYARTRRYHRSQADQGGLT